MQYQQFIIDAFTSKPFHGNPAAVCPLDFWLDESLLQAIAAENNLSETAFLVRRDTGFELRWFTPETEVDLCGHATLAAAHALFHHLNHTEKTITFFTRSGELIAQQQNGLIEISFPASEPQPCTPSDTLLRALGGEPIAFLSAEDYLVVYPNEQAILALNPDMQLLKHVDLRGVIVTAPGTSCDFVSRFFAPNAGIDEDPVTGSAHCQLTPYWAKQLGKTELQAIQVSQRRGEILCKLAGNRVILYGNAVTFSCGEITIPTV